MNSNNRIKIKKHLIKNTDAFLIYVIETTLKGDGRADGGIRGQRAPNAPVKSPQKKYFYFFAQTLLTKCPKCDNI